MLLTERIEHDMKEAMKAKDESTLSTIRMARSALKNKQIDAGHPLTDDEAEQTIRTMVKQYTDALADFTSAGRTDLAERQAQEISFLKAYLPAEMSESEIDAIVRKVIAATPSLASGGATVPDQGRVMGAVMKEIAGRADGNTVRRILESRLKS